MRCRQRRTYRRPIRHFAFRARIRKALFLFGDITVDGGYVNQQQLLASAAYSSFCLGLGRRKSRGQSHKDFS